jgi:FAD:protein FMN transferase
MACRSVTIVAESATLADALSTGVFVLGPTAGMKLIERLQHVEGVIVSGKNEVLVSSGLRPHLMLLAPPTDAP